MALSPDIEKLKSIIYTEDQILIKKWNGKNFIHNMMTYINSLVESIVCIIKEEQNKWYVKINLLHGIEMYGIIVKRNSPYVCENGKFMLVVFLSENSFLSDIQIN